MSISLPAEATGPVVAVFGASNTAAHDGAFAQAVRCGRLLADNGCVVLTGGYGGTMEAVSQGAAGAGGHVIGVTAPGVFAGRSGANGYVVEEIPAPSLTKRIDIMIDLADACIALDGSIGTLTELLVAWNVAFVARFSGVPPKPVVAVGERWGSLVGDLTGLLATDGSLVTVVPDVDEAVAAVVGALAG
jgi:uncharacterized protein (TIGR00730 family)